MHKPNLRARPSLAPVFFSLTSLFRLCVAFVYSHIAYPAFPNVKSKFHVLLIEAPRLWRPFMMMVSTVCMFLHMFSLLSNLFRHLWYLDGSIDVGFPSRRASRRRHRRYYPLEYKEMQKRIIGIARERSAKIGDEIFDGKRWRMNPCARKKGCLLPEKIKRWTYVNSNTTENVKRCLFTWNMLWKQVTKIYVLENKNDRCNMT